MSQIQIFDYSIGIGNTLLLSLILLLPVLAIGILMIAHKPRYFEAVGMMLGVLLNIPYLFLGNILAAYMGWWEYTPSPNSFYNIPIELVIGWSVFWGAFLPYIFRVLPLAIFMIVPVVIAALLDIWLMPQMDELFDLGQNWLIGEAVIVILCLVPSLIIFKLTADRKSVMLRAFMQSFIWGGWIVFLIPAIVLHFEGKNIFAVFQWPVGYTALFCSGMIASMAIGYAALWEFAKKGRGTPIPFDPPQKLVRTGIYAYVANPLQISTLLIFACIMLAFQSWLMIGPIIAHIIYCELFVRWHHSIDIEHRFGEEWQAYKQDVKNWRPRLRRLKS